MFQTDFPPLASPAPTRPTAPTQGLGGGAAFRASFEQGGAEIGRFISQGSASEAGSSLPALSPAARLYQAQLGASPLPGSAPLAAGANLADKQAFVSELRPYAEQAAGRLGVAPELVLAHAALESGWGQRPLRRAGGASSHNLFGIKAGADYRGDSLTALTTEHEDGADRAQLARFRDYADYGAAFDDYAGLLLGQKRYRGALQRGDDALGFAQALSQGGYATDPDYAAKLARVAGEVKALAQRGV